ncbi:MAG: carboxypeptidase-like regulatory domain-containing protein, partial [candidate division Zixibacteria bacterium]|nr:carboxypeptidase-like regulatory domain-containing protein [candidate division Zixibacteria bacterium]
MFDREDGQPVASATVMLSGSSFGAITDANGRYRLESTPAGTYDLTVTAVGYDTAVVRSVTVLADVTVRCPVELT